MKPLLILKQKYKALFKTFKKISRLFFKLLIKSTGLLFNNMKKTTLIFLKKLPKFKFLKLKWEKLISKEFLILFSVLVTSWKILLSKIIKFNNKTILTINCIHSNNLWNNLCNFNQENFSVRGQNHFKTFKTNPVTNSVSHLKDKLFKLKWNFKGLIINARNEKKNLRRNFKFDWYFIYLI